MRRRTAFIRAAAWILFVPVFGLLVSGGIGAWLVTVERPEAQAYEACEVLWKASASLLVLTLAVPFVFGGVTFALGRRPQWLARLFPLMVRLTMIGLACLLILHGLLLAYAAQQLTIITSYPGLFLAGVCFAIGFAVAALLIVWEALRRQKPEPIRVTGRLLGAEQLPELTAHIGRVAKQLNVSPPARVIVGLEFRAFVTRLPVSLRGAGVLESAETLYLPTGALRALDQDQLDGVIAHELAHFRGEDVAFTERFIPSFLALQNTIATLSPQGDALDSTVSRSGYSVLPRIPGWLLTQLMVMVTGIAVARIRRARELEADRVGAQVASPEAFARALVKCSLLVTLWDPFRAANVRYLGSGRARSNLSADFLASAGGLLETPAGDLFRRALPFSKLKHPTDVHPSLAERIRALGLDPEVTVNESLAELTRAANLSAALLDLESQITAIENEWMSRPGMPVVMDTEAALPAMLRLQLKSAATAAQP